MFSSSEDEEDIHIEDEKIEKKISAMTSKASYNFQQLSCHQAR